MNQLTSPWMTTVWQNLAAGLLLWGITKILSINKVQIMKFAKAMHSRASQYLPTLAPVAAKALNALFLILLMAYLLHQVRTAANAPPPLTGWDVVAISFWTWWALLLFLYALGARFAPVGPNTKPPKAE